MKLPDGPARLFPGADRAAAARKRHRPWLIGRLLEEGDRRDLAWLTAKTEEERLREWLIARGARQLSSRSQAFWSLVLGLPRPAPRDDSLWPH